MRTYSQIESLSEKAKAILCCVKAPVTFDDVLVLMDEGEMDIEERGVLIEALRTMDFIETHGEVGPDQKIWVREDMQETILGELDVNRESVV
jgi:hypothetical protein